MASKFSVSRSKHSTNSPAWPCSKVLGLSGMIFHTQSWKFKAKLHHIIWHLHHICLHIFSHWLILVIMYICKYISERCVMSQSASSTYVHNGKWSLCWILYVYVSHEQILLRSILVLNIQCIKSHSYHCTKDILISSFDCTLLTKEWKYCWKIDVLKGL